MITYYVRLKYWSGGPSPEAVAIDVDTPPLGGGTTGAIKFVLDRLGRDDVRSVTISTARPRNFLRLVVDNDNPV